MIRGNITAQALAAQVLRIEPFNSAKKVMGVALQLPSHEVRLPTLPLASVKWAVSNPRDFPPRQPGAAVPLGPGQGSAHGSYPLPKGEGILRCGRALPCIGCAPCGWARSRAQGRACARSGQPHIHAV